MTKLSILLLLALGLQDAPRDKAAWREIFGSSALDSEAFEILRHLCDRIGHRLTGTDNGRRAEEYVLERLRAYGLKAHHEEFELLLWERGDLAVEVVEPTRRRLDAIALGNTPSADVKGVVVDVGYGTPAEFRNAGASVQGKIALVKSGAPPGHRSVHRSEKMTLSRQNGAIAMVMINGTPGNVPQAGTCALGELAPIPGLCVSKEEGEWISRVAAEQPVTMSISAKARSGKGTARNVIGDLPGTTAEVVMIGAHLDSWDLAQGAIDNGTGSAIVLEAARLLAQLRKPPRRTIRVALFMGEEFGLWGSKAYLKRHADAREEIVCLGNFDMEGKPVGFQLYGCDEGLPYFKELARDLRHMGMSPDAVTSKMGLHSDHQPFMLAGIPAWGLRSPLDEDQAKYYHTAGDTFDLAKEEYLRDAAAVVAATVWDLANAETLSLRALSKEEVIARLERDGLKEALELTGEWPGP
ncbi:MAG: M20/M25/M40 family metallo-hydrolase [Planctomycetes bacterium]|nr:M20/M25/M40 family metallo-hydrolase [Planctomycetota bacterium]